MSLQNFFFYDLETSGLSPRFQRVMQFAGQRTDMDLRPIGEPYNFLVKLPEDILPDPQAIIITGTTPQKTREEGISEPEFAKMLIEEIFTPGTIAVGFNTVRFDDEFIRHTLWRNFYDPYEWAWSEGRSRWDILDLVRMTRAMRPDGIEWPFADDGSPVNKLELLSKVNKLEHTHAHDALSDVEATIGLARLISQKQPKLFSYLLKMRDKNDLKKLINLDNPQPFVYSSGRYGRKHLFTTVAIPIAEGARPGSVVVYDLRYDPRRFENTSAADIRNILLAPWEEKRKDDFQPIPVKELAYNKCPAVAPLSVMDAEAWVRLDLDKDTIEENTKHLTQSIIDKIIEALSDKPKYDKAVDIEGALYDSFIDNADKPRMKVVREADESELSDLTPQFIDERFSELLIRYKARNFPRSLNETEQAHWQDYLLQKFTNTSSVFFKKLQEAAANASDQDAFILEELRLWYESVTPIE